MKPEKFKKDLETILRKFDEIDREIMQAIEKEKYGCDRSMYVDSNKKTSLEYSPLPT